MEVRLWQSRPIPPSPEWVFANIPGGAHAVGLPTSQQNSAVLCQVSAWDSGPPVPVAAAPLGRRDAAPTLVKPGILTDLENGRNPPQEPIPSTGLGRELTPAAPGMALSVWCHSRWQAQCPAPVPGRGCSRDGARGASHRSMVRRLTICSARHRKGVWGSATPVSPLLQGICRVTKQPG